MSVNITVPYEQSVLHHLHEAILVFDPYANSILEVNPALCRLVDYSTDTLHDLPVTRLFASDYAALIVFTQAVLDKGSTWTDELILRTRNGDSCEVEVFASILPQQQRAYITAIVHDKHRLRYLRKRAAANVFVREGLTVRKRNEKIFTDMERENQLLLQAVGEGIYSVNADGKTTFVNSAAERILGWTAAELVGTEIHYHSDDCPNYAAYHDGVVHRNANAVFRHKNGTPIPIEYISTPVFDQGQLVGAVIVFRDVREQKQAEAKLHDALHEVDVLNQRLEMENTNLQEEIRELQNVIERAAILSRGNHLTPDLPQCSNDVAGIVPCRTANHGESIMTRKILHEVERNNIIRALQLCGGKIFGENGAADMLGVKPTTLASRIKRLRIDKQRLKEQGSEHN